MIARLIDEGKVEGISTIERKAKRCPRCGLLKPIKEFYRNRARPDGRSDWCKDCKKDHKYSKPPVATIMPGQKQCTSCKVIKSRSEFHRCSNRADGLQSRCKECSRAVVAERQRKRKAKKDAAERGRGDFKIFNIQQMDSVVREMAGTQLEIEAELRVCQQRVSRMIQDSAEALGPRRRRMKMLKNAIECYFIREGRTKATNKLRFGSVRFYRDNAEVDLDVNQAERCMGKP